MTMAMKTLIDMIEIVKLLILYFEDFFQGIVVLFKLW